MGQPRECPCGSGQWPNAEYDGHGIFMFYGCAKCRKKKLAGYRPDIKERYECDEPIEAEDY